MFPFGEEAIDQPTFRERNSHSEGGSQVVAYQKYSQEQEIHY